MSNMDTVHITAKTRRHMAPSFYSFNKEYRENNIAADKARNEVLHTADVVCCGMVSSDHC